VPVFGYKNHIGIDREHGFLRRYTVTNASAYDGGQLGAVLDRDNTASDVWADTAYRSAANLALLERRGLRPQFQRKKPRGKKMPDHMPAATPPVPGRGLGSSTSLPPRNAGSSLSFARLAWCGRA
jgi:Transposase DDE domain